MCGAFTSGSKRLAARHTCDLSEAVARYLFKLMAYKDEYEVARLSLKPEARAALREQFGEGATLHYHLQPPILKHFGNQAEDPRRPLV